MRCTARQTARHSATDAGSIVVGIITALAVLPTRARPAPTRASADLEPTHQIGAERDPVLERQAA
ncbi:MAG: hypothetical protein ACLP22_14990 [Solirubrobacteraceae bacterium]